MGITPLFGKALGFFYMALFRWILGTFVLVEDIFSLQIGWFPSISFISSSKDVSYTVNLLSVSAFLLKVAPVNENYEVCFVKGFKSSSTISLMLLDGSIMVLKSLVRSSSKQTLIPEGLLLKNSDDISVSSFRSSYFYLQSTKLCYLKKQGVAWTVK